MGTKNKKQQKTQQNGQSTDPELKFYLKEFSGRLLLLLGSFVVAAIVGFEFKDIIQTLVTLQLADLNMVNFTQAEGMLPTMQISLLAGVLGGLPFAVYHIYRFFAPILVRGAWYGFRMVSGSIILLIAAVTYAFMVTIPLGLSGMVATAETHVATQAFLTFAVGNAITAALLSQLPIAVIFLNGIKPFSTKKFLVLQGSGVVAIMLSAAIATSFASPAKGVTGILLLAAPIITLFEASMFWAKIHGRVIVKDMPQELTTELTQQEQAERTAETRPQQVTVNAQQTTPAVAPLSVSTPQVASLHAAPTATSVAAPAVENTQPTLEDIFDAMLADDSDEPEEYYQDEKIETVAEPAYVPVYRAPQPQFAPAPAPSQPSASVVSHMGMPAYRPQPLPQPRPATTRRPTYSRPIADMLRPSQATTPQLRSLNTPRQTIPFQTTTAH